MFLSCSFLFHIHIVMGKNNKFNMRSELDIFKASISQIFFQMAFALQLDISGSCAFTVLPFFQLLSSALFQKCFIASFGIMKEN